LHLTKEEYCLVSLAVFCLPKVSKKNAYILIKSRNIYIKFLIFKYAAFGK
ncbi:MAG: hypothetical protein ACI956_002261, partial [Nonlabens sp.]